MENKKLFIMSFGSSGWDRIYSQTADGNKELVYEEEGKKNSHQAVAAKKAGADAMLISFVGNDEFGGKVIESLKEGGIDTRFVKTVEGETTEVSEQILNKETGEYTVTRLPTKLPQYYYPSMVEEYKEWLLKADAVLLVSKQNKDFLEAMIDFCYKHDIPVAMTVSIRKFDINDKRDIETLKKVKFIAVNYEEACDLTRVEDIEKMLKLLPNMLITKGPDGVYFVDENGEFKHEKAVAVEKVVDTNGAGDTFISNFLVFYLEGQEKTECARRAQCASAIEIQGMGFKNVVPDRKKTDELYDNIYNQKFIEISDL